MKPTQINNPAPRVSEESVTNKPVATFRAGNVSASIWENNIKKTDGTYFKKYTTTMQRSYKKPNSETWEHTNSLETRDLVKAQLVLGKAIDFLFTSEPEEPEQ